MTSADRKIIFASVEQVWNQCQYAVNIRASWILNLKQYCRCFASLLLFHGALRKSLASLLIFSCSPHVLQVQALANSTSSESATSKDLLDIPQSRKRQELKKPIGIMSAQGHRWVQYEEVCSTLPLNSPPAIEPSAQTLPSRMPTAFQKASNAWGTTLIPSDIRSKIPEAPSRGLRGSISGSRGWNMEG